MRTSYVGSTLKYEPGSSLASSLAYSSEKRQEMREHFSVCPTKTPEQQDFLLHSISSIVQTKDIVQP
jgi:hypothetical protein